MAGVPSKADAVVGSCAGTGANGCGIYGGPSKALPKATGASYIVGVAVPEISALDPQVCPKFEFSNFTNGLFVPFECSKLTGIAC